tara:strand:+ start:617 stop:922 length:306 start_codon:yes stop_codon:yes gene_type:complete
MNIKVRNFFSTSGNQVPNQFIIETPAAVKGGTAIYFQSYNTIIAKKIYPKNKIEKIYLDLKFWDCSNTTGKYRNQFLGENIVETRNKIKTGEYKLINLNKD